MGLQGFLFLSLIPFLEPGAGAAPKTREKTPAASASATPGAKPHPPADDTAQRVASKALQSMVTLSHFGREGKSDGIGTGFVVSTDGLIATSLHVIGEGRPITVTAPDGRKLEVMEVTAWDRRFDLALLRVRERNLPPLAIGDSDALKQGEDVIAIGNPMGYEASVVRGVLSARRPIEGVEMLQVAIPIEPGNSGGPLIDLEGRVQGVIALKSVMTANIGFAVPINGLKKLLARPSPVPIDRWLNMGALDPAEWEPLMGARWRQRVDRVVVEGPGDGFGGRALCLSRKAGALKPPYELAVTVKLDDEAGAAGLAFASDGGERHYGFYPTAGQLRLTRFDGADVTSWTILQTLTTEHYNKGEWNRIKVRVEPGRILCFVNGHQVFESADHAFAGDRAGLCKFRGTQAEFKDLVFGPEADAPATPLPDSLVTQLQEYLRSRDHAREGEVTQALLKAPSAGRRYLGERARQLEQDAVELRRLAQVAHARQVEASLKETLTAGEKEIDLVQAALLVAQLDDPDLQPESYRRHVDRMGRELLTEIPAGADDAAKLRALRHYFFEEQGFHGSRGEFHDRANSYLNNVIEHREGIPITLSLLFIEVGQRVGLAQLRAHPLPGHFMAAIKLADGTDHVIDVFEGGRELTHEEADLVVRQFSEGDVKSELLEPARKRDIIVRMVRNLATISRADGADNSTLRYLDLILALQPSAHIDRLERAKVRARSNDIPGAKEDLQWLLDHAPPGIVPDRIEELLKSL